ncbi:MAG TPA: hypothetical protein PKD90_17875, partial [Phnomibacter sp.]|nr:hypothetical protein [Phnomibacter sp.]
EQMKEVEGSGQVYIEYPGNMQVGMELPNGQVTIQSATSGINTTAEVNITNRKVAGQEKITTPAGSWDCYKITSNLNLRMKIAGIGIPFNTEQTEWFAPGFGIVRSESKTGTVEVTAVK